jgi:thiol-disulfide isomerase/thioredoxin
VTDAELARLRPSRWVGAAILAAVLAPLAALLVSAVDTWRQPPRAGLGEAAPALVGETLDGAPFALTSLRGKVVLLDFWATWCPGCTSWIPIAERLDRRYARDGFVLVGANVEDEEVERVRTFVRERRLQAPQLVVGPDVQGRFGTFQLPTYWLVGRDGTVRGVWRGALDEATAQREIEAALAE